MNNTEFVLHETQLLNLPLIRSSFKIEELIVNFEGRSLSLDFGSRCYLIRDNSQRKIHKSHLCILDSICKKRQKFLNDVVTIFSDHLKHKLKRISTLYAISRSLLLFIDWADINNHSNFSESTQSVRSAFRSYLSDLEQKVRSGTLGNNTAVNEQNNLIGFFYEYFEDEKFYSGLRLIRFDSKLIKYTEVPCEISQSQSLALTETLFLAITNFIIDFGKFPFSIEMPKYLGWKEPNLWIFPNVVKFMTPDMLDKRATFPRPNWPFDYKNGLLLTQNELFIQTGIKLSQQNFDLAQKAIDAANLDEFNHHRRTLAMIAHNCFVFLFLAATGHNLTQLRDQTWNDSYAVSSSRQGFRSIKARANSKEMFFELRTEFIKYFKLYLKLRKFLLNENPDFEFLFISFNRLHGLQKFDGDQSNENLYYVLQKIDPNITKINSKNWRVAKGDFTLNTTDVKTAALVLQNSEQTLRKHYAAGSQTKAASEMSDFFEKLSSTVSFERPSSELKNISIGECADYGNPLKDSMRLLHEAILVEHFYVKRFFN